MYEMAKIRLCVRTKTANYAPARQLKNVLVDLIGDAVVHQVEPAVK